jgi:hypothetical protein
MDKKDMDFQPVNINERLLYGCMIRLDALCEMVNSIVEYIANKEGVATTSNELTAPIEEEVVVKPAPKKTTKKK